MKRVVAIDGPAAAGKSTVAKKLAAKIGYTYIDTGAMYRAVALQCIRQGISWQQEEDCVQIAATCEIELFPNDNGNDGCIVLLNGEEVSGAIRTAEVAQGASCVSAIAGVRQILVKKQQALAARGRVVMEGRDIGTAVLPEADCKIFMTASLACRAERRQRQLEEKGASVSFPILLAEMKGRDERDSNRSHSPLRQAEDAVYLDTTNLTIEEVVNRIWNNVIGEK